MALNAWGPLVSVPLRLGCGLVGGDEGVLPLDCAMILARRATLVKKSPDCASESSLSSASALLGLSLLSPRSQSSAASGSSLGVVSLVLTQLRACAVPSHSTMMRAGPRGMRGCSGAGSMVAGADSDGRPAAAADGSSATISGRPATSRETDAGWTLSPCDLLDGAGCCARAQGRGAGTGRVCTDPHRPQLHRAPWHTLHRMAPDAEHRPESFPFLEVLCSAGTTHTLALSKAPSQRLKANPISDAKRKQFREHPQQAICIDTWATLVRKALVYLE
ncbi:hypothetical protein L1887_62738 [Cichorium endivia]|nr:hypothetical protein L1887_62738 [Cichorium endivia]